MIFFITFLRALAACLITNAHYTGIYPTDLIANGGLLGDVLFFAVSGYCLFHVKYPLSVSGFGRWYGRRVLRVYTPVLIMTVVFMIIGRYRLSDDQGVFWWYVYPTYYHFVSSILILYIPFFFIMKIPALRGRLPLIMIILAGIWMLLYWTVYDRSFYHIDSVHEPMIRLLFLESMLLGAWFRQHDGELRNRFRWSGLTGTVILLVVYFASKLSFSGRAALAPLQFVNQFAIFALLYFLFRTFSGLDARLEKLPVPVKRVIQFISDMTLEIYVVQYVIIDVIREQSLFFPLNWFALTAAILIAAYILHQIVSAIYKLADRRRK